MDLFTISYEEDENVIDAIVSFNPPTTESEHIIEKEDIGKVVSTTGGVLLGKMSFKMTANEFDISGFELVTDTSSPTTGIKINLNLTQSFEAQSTFRFTDQTASRDATLSNIVISSGETDEENPSNSTYKEHNLTPTFNKETFNYEIELLEYIDTMKIKATTSDENATMKIKVPKRDENNNLVYDTDETTIIYEEKEIQSDTPLEFTLNKLGEPDTHLTINITAEDEKTTSTYEIVIKRPYGIVKGSVYVPPIASTTGIHKADIKFYKTEEVAKEIDLSAMAVAIDKSSVHSTLITLNSKNYITNDDGTYEIYIIPGEYDILIDKSGYLDHIYKSRQINEGDVLDLGEEQLVAGDLNKDGIINQRDMGLLYNTYGSKLGESRYDNNLAYDFNEDTYINQRDTGYALNNYTKAMKIE